LSGAVTISFDDTRYGINLSTALDYLVSVCLNATAPLIFQNFNKSSNLQSTMM